MCVIKITRWGCRCEKREVVDCKKFGKRKENPFWKMMVRARLLACPKTRYEVTPKKTVCLSRECPKRREHASKIPVVPLRKTARGTTGFLYSERREQRAPAPHAPAPTRHRANANVEQHARHDRMRERRHDDRPAGHRQERPRAPPAGKPQERQPREQRAGDLRRADGRRLPKDLEGTRADPRTRHGERLAQKIELPRLGNADRRGVAVNAPRVVSHHGVILGETPTRRVSQPTRPPVRDPSMRRHPHREAMMPPPPVPFKNHARRAPSPDVPPRPRAPVHGYEYRPRRHNPILRTPSPPPRHPARRRRSRIPEPIYARSPEAPIPRKVRIARENEIPRAQRIEKAFAQIPLNPRPNPIFANQRNAPKKEKKKGLFQKMFKIDDRSDTDSELSFECVGLPQEQLAHSQKSPGEGAWWNNDLVVVSNR
ncbi:hypothetical protein V8F20_009778 [Naviculisporaceae sp. PSN 640]